LCGKFKSSNIPKPITAPYVANFSGSPLSGNAPLAVTFTSTSTGTITSYKWDFGDGGTSSGTNVSHTYLNSSTNDVTLTVTGPGGSSSKTNLAYIAVTNLPNPVAGFTASPLTGSVPLAVSFVNTSSGAASYNWNFGDGNLSSLISPSHTYNSTGTFSPSLFAFMGSSYTFFQRTNYIVVTNLPAPSISFSANITNGQSPLSVILTNQSLGASSFIMSFGDGVTNTATSIGLFTHTYTNGSYTVRLTGSSAGGTNTLSKTNYIVVTNGPPIIVITNKPPFWIRVMTQ
jgi:PKD repeat protein